jgi:hypothetical protein
MVEFTCFWLKASALAHMKKIGPTVECMSSCSGGNRFKWSA